MKKILLLLLMICVSLLSNSQESNNGKKIWAKSFLNKKAPKVVVEKWLTEKPELKDKFVLIDFWATWCGPCRRAIPKLNHFHEKYKDKLIVMGVSKEKEGHVRRMKKPVINYFSAIDTQDRMGGELKIKGIPHVIIIDPHGIVRWEGFPMLQNHELTDKVIERLLEKYK